VRRTLLASLCLLASAQTASAGLRFVKAELSVPGQILWGDSGDLDGDGLTDLVLSYQRGTGPESQRFLAVFFRSEQGWPPKPDLLLTAPAAAVLFDLGDALPSPGVEIVYLTSFGVMAQSVAGRHAGQASTIVRARTVAGPAEEEDFLRWDFFRSLGPGQGDVILVPTRGPLELWRLEEGTWKRWSKVKIQSFAYYDAESITYKAGRRGGGGARPFSLRVTTIVPTITLADQDGDARADLIATYEDRYAIHPMRPDGTISSTASQQRWLHMLTPEEQAARDTELTMDVQDIDGDGVADLSATKIGGGVTNLRSETRIYLGKKGGGFASSPVQVFKDSGFASIIRYIDLDGDGKNEMVHPFVEVSILSMSQVLLSSKMTLDLRIRKRSSSPGKLFEEDPVQSLDMIFGLDFSTGGALRGAAPIYGVDFDGDGKKDVIICKGSEELELHRGTKNGDEPFEDDGSITLSAPVSRETYAVPQRADGKGLVDIVVTYTDQPKRAGKAVVFIPQR
jgi:hypothetical protein